MQSYILKLLDRFSARTGGVFPFRTVLMPRRRNARSDISLDSLGSCWKCTQRSP